MTPITQVALWVFSLSLVARWGTGVGGKEGSHNKLPWEADCIEVHADLLQCVCSLAHMDVLHNQLRSYRVTVQSVWVARNPCHVRVYGGGKGDSMSRQCVCRQRTESRQCPGLWCQTRGSTVCWDSTISHLVLQRLRFAQTAAGGVGASHGPCLLVTPSE